MNRTVERAVFAFLRVHDTVYQRTGGWIGQWVPGMPNSLLLHTVGAKTGQPRTHTLTYAEDGGRYLIVASNGGAHRFPAWYHNLKAHPDVEINLGPRRLPATARIVTPDDADYGRLWDIANKNNSNRYRDYQKRTPRPIPVIVLTPR
ncbi:MAG: nitroreductase family deazaflavin-dependent oxidoreductase [Mycobacterium sp.]|nr:nitroreductase family deazaflavin-dependent oxidoreductase [Mycobacterium sp.]